MTKTWRAFFRWLQTRLSLSRGARASQPAGPGSNPSSLEIFIADFERKIVE